MKAAIILVGAHLLLGAVLLVVAATHGINDQDASYALALLFHGLNYPTVLLLRLRGSDPGIAAVLLAGIVPWAILGAALSAAWRAVRHRAKRPGAFRG